MAKKIVAIGLELASDELDEHSFTSEVSLLDWDIVLFKPDISPYTSWTRETYLGKPSLNDDVSFQLRAAIEHWRREIRQAIEAGKTVVVFLSSVETVYVATGERQFSGTGLSLTPFLDHPEPEFSPRRAHRGLVADERLASAAGVS